MGGYKHFAVALMAACVLLLAAAPISALAGAAAEAEAPLLARAGAVRRLAAAPPACSSSMTGIMAPFAVWFAGAAAANGSTAAAFTFTLAAFPDTSVAGATTTPSNIYCQQLPYYSALRSSVKPADAASNACCSRATAGAPSRLVLTLDSKCATNRGLDALAITLDGVAIPRSSGSGGTGFVVNGSKVEVPLGGWAAGAAGGDARGALVLSLPTSNPCVSASSAALMGPCSGTDGCNYELSTAPPKGGAAKACCRVSGTTWDAFAPPQLRSRDAHGVANMTERYLVIGDAGSSVDGDYNKGNKSKGGYLPPFTPAARAGYAPWLVRQHEVGRQMAKAAEYLRPEYIINTGDNFYHLGLNNSAPAKLFDLTFRRPYMQYKALANLTWLSVLGNHDAIMFIEYIQEFGGAGQAFASCTPNLSANVSLAACLAAPCCFSPAFQTTAVLAEPRWRLEFDVWKAGEGRLLELTFLNSNPIAYLPKGRTLGLYTNVPGGLASMNATQYLIDLAAAIAPPPPPAPFRWRAVVAHHPLRDFGPHCVNPSMPFPTWETECVQMEAAQKIARKAGLHLWLNGHDHAQEVIALNVTTGSPGNGTTWAVTSGAGSLSNWLTAMKDKQPPGLVWPVIGTSTCTSKAGKGKGVQPRQYLGDQGFVGLGVTSDKLVIQVYSTGTVPQCASSKAWVKAYSGLAFNQLLRRSDYA